MSTHSFKLTFIVTLLYYRVTDIGMAVTVECLERKSGRCYGERQTMSNKLQSLCKTYEGGRLSATGKLGCHENLVTLDQMKPVFVLGKFWGQEIF